MHHNLAVTLEFNAYDNNLLRNLVEHLCCNLGCRTFKEQYKFFPSSFWSAEQHELQSQTLREHPR